MMRVRHYWELNMKPLKTPLRAVLYQQGGRWYAHCLEFDLLGDGSKPEKALESLKKTIPVHIDACIRHDALNSLFTPAEGRFFRMYAAGKQLAESDVSEFTDNADTIRIESLVARQYEIPVDSDVDLAIV